MQLPSGDMAHLIIGHPLCAVVSFSGVTGSIEYKMGSPTTSFLTSGTSSMIIVSWAGVLIPGFLVSFRVTENVSTEFNYRRVSKQRTPTMHSLSRAKVCIL